MRNRLLAASVAVAALSTWALTVSSQATAATTPAQTSAGWHSTCATSSSGACSIANPTGVIPDAVTATPRQAVSVYIKSATASTITLTFTKLASTSAYVGSVSFDVHADYTPAAPTSPATTVPTAPTSTAPTSVLPTTPDSVSPSAASPSPSLPVSPSATPSVTPTGTAFPDASTTGVPAGTTLTAYTGPCTITTAGTVIDSKTVSCDLSIRAAGVIIRNSVVDGEVSDYDQAGGAFTIQDSRVVNGARDACMCVGSHDFTATRVEVIGGNRGMYCERRCTIRDSFIHDTDLKATQHASAIRVEQYTTLIHNTLQCDWTAITDTEIGCSADMTGYPDFAPIHDNTIDNNLFVANPVGIGYCAYGGGTGNKPYSNDPTNATNVVFRNNVFQRGSSRKCGAYGPVTDFIPGRTGNVWTGNVWDSGETVPAA